MTDDTRRFRKKLEDLNTLAARSHGRLSVQQIQEVLKESFLSAQQLQMVYAYLDQMAIEVYDPETEEGGEAAPGRRPSLEVYLEELDHFPPLPEDRELLLFRRASGGDRAAAGELVERYLATAADLAAEFEDRSGHVEVEDLVQEANTGLCLGVMELPAQESLAGYRAWLLNYVTSWLENRIKDLEEQMNSDSRVVNRMNRLADTVRELEEELGHKPSVDELSAFLELPSEDILNLLRIAGNDLNLDR